MFRYYVFLSGILAISADFNGRSNHTIDSKQLLNQHLKIFILIGCLSVGVMMIIVSVYIAMRYCTMKKKHAHLRLAEQTRPLNRSVRR